MGWATLLTDWEVRVADSSDQTPSFADRQTELRDQITGVAQRETAGVCVSG